MVAIDDIKDGETLYAWLNETNQPRRSYVALAVRAALRVLPLVWAEVQISRGAEASPALRESLFSHIFGLGPRNLMSQYQQDYSDFEVKPTIRIRATLTKPFEESTGGLENNAIGSSVIDAERAHANAIADAAMHAANAINAAAVVVKNFDSASFINTINSAARAETYLMGESLNIDYNKNNNIRIFLDKEDLIWRNIVEDCKSLQGSVNFVTEPLFYYNAPSWIEDINARKAQYSEGSFWYDWYGRVLEGRPQNWHLLIDIATQDNVFWQGSDDEVNARIAEIIGQPHELAAGNLTGSSPVLHGGTIITVDGATVTIEDEIHAGIAERAEQHALKASYAARRVVIDEQTKLLRAEVITEIEPGFFDIALGRLRDAVDGMRATPGFANQYTALEPELRRIDDYLARHHDKPLRIYEVATRTGTLIRAKIEDGQLPEDDPLLEDFQTEVDNTALDILHGDPEVEKVVRQRSVGRFDRLDRAQKEHFRGITPQIIPICEDSLAQELQEEIATATDPHADSQDQAEAMWRWAGLVLRIFRVVRERVHDYAAYVTLANAERGHFISFFL